MKEFAVLFMYKTISDSNVPGYSCWQFLQFCQICFFAVKPYEFGEILTIFCRNLTKTAIVVGALGGLLRVIDGSPLKALVSLHWAQPSFLHHHIYNLGLLPTWFVSYCPALPARAVSEYRAYKIECSTSFSISFASQLWICYIVTKIRIWGEGF